MFEIEIYETASGRSEIAEWLEELNAKARTSKVSRTRLKKIAEYLELLKAYGTQIGEPAVKHLTNSNLWELRPMRDRILFAYWRDNKFILLSHFEKKTQKTPPREIKKAERILADFLERDE